MDHDDGARSSTKEIPVYSWHNKQEGKEEYAKFSKEFSIHIKQLRYLLDPAAVTRRLGPAPAPNPPANAVLRKEWREDRIRYENRLIKIDSDFAEALSALERSFLFASPPRHIIDKTIENRPADVEDVDWNYERKFRACWEALRAEYQPSTAVDLSQHEIKSLPLVIKPQEASILFVQSFIDFTQRLWQLVFPKAFVTLSSTA